uniref:Uncharacterized protein n=1 Tax=Tanacetum cinerariifolium TaxID=118510 RepID=A0A699INM4_TANCI|nr:hypothetical protein [Tanacetum cinerariifolium]
MNHYGQGPNSSKRKLTDLSEGGNEVPLPVREYSCFGRARALQVPEIYETNALASSWGFPKTKLRHEDEKRDIPIVKRTSSLCVVPVHLSEDSPENLSENSSSHPFGYLRRHVPQYHVISC